MVAGSIWYYCTVKFRTDNKDNIEDERSIFACFVKYSCFHVESLDAQLSHLLVYYQEHVLHTAYCVEKGLGFELPLGL